MTALLRTCVTAWPDPDALSRIAADTARLRDAMETDFVAAGDSLITACDRFMALEEPMRAIADLTGSAAVSRIVSAVRDFDAAVTAGIADIAVATRPLLQLHAATGQLKSNLFDLGRVVRTMGIVALNARVIAAGIGAAEQGLTGFTSDADRLVSNAAEVLRRMVASLDRLSALSKRARVSADAFLQSLGRQVSSGLKDLADRLLVAERWLETTVSSSGALARRAEQIRGEMARTVMSLQSGDATRQRLDHILAVLSAAMDAPDPASAAALGDLARRQAAGAAEQHLPNVATACVALDRTGDGTVALLTDLGAAFAGSPALVMMREALAGLDRAFETSRATQEAFGRETAALLAECQSIIGLANGIRDLGERMQLIGMNAVISCANLGPQGLPLRETALQLRQLAHSAQALHGALCGDLAALETTTDRAQSDLEATSGRLNTVLAADQAKLPACWRSSSSRCPR